jgi:hypothetical protein
MGAVAMWAKNRIEDYMLRPVEIPAPTEHE